MTNSSDPIGSRSARSMMSHCYGTLESHTIPCITSRANQNTRIDDIMQHFIPRRLRATCLTIPLVVVALCPCPQWAIDRWTRDSELVIIKNQSEHMHLSWTAHLCTASFATGFSVHPIGCRDAFGMTRPRGWTPVRSSAATAGPDGRWTGAVCNPKIARG